MHKLCSVVLTDSPYSYGEYEPGRIRHSAGFDIGCFQEPYYDPKRWQMARAHLARDYGLSEEEIENKMEKMVVGRRPLSPDNLEIIGAMKYYPNIILNLGYGP